MAFYLTTTGSLRREIAALPPKNRARGFLAIPVHRTRCFGPQPLAAHRKNQPTPTKTASGLSCWLTRDPIGERGGPNVYAFVLNDALDRVDPYGLAGWTVHFNEGPTPYRGGATKAVVPTVDANIASDSTCSKKGCYRLTVKSVDMDVWLWPGPSVASYFHEQMHVNDYKVWTYTPLAAYANGKAGCYSQKQAECWQKVVKIYAPMKFFYEGAYHTFVDRDFNPLWPSDWSTKSTMWSAFSTSMTLLQSWESFCPSF